MHWGHAISRNLVTWEELPIALKPNSLGAIFSGSAVVDFKNTAGFKTSPQDKDPIVAIYTSASTKTQKQSIAYSLNGGYNFTVFEGNPVLSPTNTSDFRDPKVFYHEDRWIMSLAVKNRVEFYSSFNLKNWTFESEFGRNPELGNHDGVWECPDLISLNMTINNKTTKLWVLFVSIGEGVSIAILLIKIAKFTLVKKFIYFQTPNRGSATQYFVGNFTRTSSTGFEFISFQWSENQWLDWGKIFMSC